MPLMLCMRFRPRTESLMRESGVSGFAKKLKRAKNNPPHPCYDIFKKAAEEAMYDFSLYVCFAQTQWQVFQYSPQTVFSIATSLGSNNVHSSPARILLKK